MTQGFEDPLDRYVVKNLLIVGADKPSVNRLVGILSSQRGLGSGGVVDQTVETLDAATRSIEAVHPNIVVIDPGVANITDVLSFVENHRKSHGNIVWIVYADRDWWHVNRPKLECGIFGKRFLEYYSLPKSSVPAELERQFIILLTLCHRDFVLQLLAEAATDIETDDPGTMSRQQITKFVDKAISPLVSLLTSPQRRSNEAFVSMAFNPAQRALYDRAIRPPLEKAGFQPVMMADERPMGPIPVEILSRIASCSLFIADLTGQRPNVLIEVGAALNSGVRMILLLASSIREEHLPFIIRTHPIYSYNSPDELIMILERHIEPTTYFSRSI